MHVRRTLTTVFVALAAAWASGPVGAQQPAPAQPVFRSGTDLVRLDIRVTDADGLPVRDLRADEVRIEEGGEPRPVLFFQHVEDPPGGYLDAGRRTVAAEVSSNQGAPRGHVYVLVFDQWHIKPGNEQKARVAAQRFLAARLKPGDRVALHALPGPGPDIPFTSDFARVIRELPAVRGMREDLGTAQPPMRVFDAYQITRGDPAVLSRYVEQFTTTAAADTQVQTNAVGNKRLAEDPAVQRQVIQDTARTVVARADLDSRQLLGRLAEIVASLRSIEGRKSVILFSEGFEPDNVTREMEEVVAAAAQSYSVFYALDLNSRAVAPEEMNPRGGEQYVEIANRLEPLGSLAAESDGVLFTDAAPQIDSVFDRIVGTSQDYYLVGFAPSGAALSNRDRYSRIRVTTTRPGVRVSARTGYALGEGPNPASRRTTVEAALAAPFTQQGLRVEYTTYSLRGTAADSQRVILSLAAQLPVGGAKAEGADVVFAVRSVQTGRLAQSGSGTMPLPAEPSAGLGDRDRLLPRADGAAARDLHDARRRARAGRPPRQRRPPLPGPIAGRAGRAGRRPDSGLVGRRGAPGAGGRVLDRRDLRRVRGVCENRGPARGSPHDGRAAAVRHDDRADVGKGRPRSDQDRTSWSEPGRRDCDPRRGRPARRVHRPGDGEERRRDGR